MSGAKDPGAEVVPCEPGGHRQHLVKRCACNLVRHHVAVSRQQLGQSRAHPGNRAFLDRDTDQCRHHALGHRADVGVVLGRRVVVLLEDRLPVVQDHDRLDVSEAGIRLQGPCQRLRHSGRRIARRVASFVVRAVARRECQHAHRTPGQDATPSPADNCPPGPRRMGTAPDLHKRAPLTDSRQRSIPVTATSMLLRLRTSVDGHGRPGRSPFRSRPRGCPRPRRSPRIRALR